MGLLNSLLGEQNSGLLGQLTQNLGITPNQTQNLLGQLIPALGGGFINHAQTTGQTGLMNLLQNTDHAPYTQAPERMAEPTAVQTGNNILSQIFGSKDVSRQVADHAAEQTGIGSAIIKKALPLVAIMAASALGDKLKQGHSNAANATNANDMLGQLFGHNMASEQPSIVSQVMNLLGGQRAA